MNIYIQNLARELSQRGHLVDIYTSTHAGDERCKTIELNKGVRLVHVPAAEYSTVTEMNLDSHVSEFANSIYLHSQNCGLQYDIIHSHYWLSGLVGNLLKERWAIPHATMFHTLAALKNNAGLSILEPGFRIRYEKSVIDSCDLIIASTHREKRELVSKYGASETRIAVIPCGINPALFRPVDKLSARRACNLDSKQVALFVGRMDPLKGLSNLLDAIAALRLRRDFQLVVIGGDSENEAEFQRMLKLIHDNSIDDIVIPVGSIPHENMYLYYNAADFCVIPSYYESFSLVALESLACGTPILSTDVGEVRDMVEICPGCRIVSDNSAATLARNFGDMLDSGDHHSIGLTGALTDRYGWDSVTEKILLAYESMATMPDELNQPACTCRERG
jgi:D-inositol-3-phosphate glycosyltransferase